MVLEEPAGCTWCWVRGSARGEGDLVGDTGTGEGDGVRASGESGMWPE